MNITLRTLGAVLAGLLITSAAADAQLSKPDQKCRDTVAKTFAKTVSAADKVIATCHKGRATTKIPAATDCNDLSQSDTKLKFDKAQTKLGEKIAKVCSPANSDVLNEFVSCPEPCGTDTGVPNPLATFADLSTCLACLAGDIAERRDADLIGLPASPPLTKEEGKCHSTVAKMYGKRLKTVLKERQKCQKAQDATSTELQPCDTQVLEKITLATTKANAAIDALCFDPMMANIDACGAAATVTDLKTCLEAEDDAAAAEAFPAGYELEPTICPVRVDSTILAGVGLAGDTRTYLDVGWTGSAHRMDLPDNYSLSVDVTCPPSAPCGSCAVDGISSAGPQYASFTRCRNDFTLPCDEPFGPDLDHCGGNDCVYLLGPPLPLSSGNNPVCTLNILDNDVSGTVNPEDGTSELDLTLRSVVHLGVGITRPCPVCSGDTIPQDGLPDGTCIAGANAGGPCDVQAFDSTFAKAEDDLGVSMDCPPASAGNISGAGLLIPLELTTGSASLPAANSCDTPLGFLDCWCGVCSGDFSQACENDADCAMTGSGTCSTSGPGAASPRQPNECNDVVAGCEVITDVPAGSNRGQCNNPVDDVELYCDGVLARRANNRGFVLCQNNASCDNTECNPLTPAPDGCGQCLLEQRRECFIDPIDATGDPDVEQPLLVATFCIPPTNAFSINGSSGLPGPARTGIEMSVDLVY